MNKFDWPLNDSQFSILDRAKILAFFANPANRWTQGSQVQKFERAMANFVGSKYAVFVSSGSTANTLLAMYLRDKVVPHKPYVVFPAVTWQTSVSPFVREGFAPKFIDVSLDDYAMDLDALEYFLTTGNANHVACVFVTSLLGFVPDIRRLREIEKKYNVRVMMDNCENTLGQFEGRNVSSFFTSTTSTYFGHQIQSVEGGFIFTDSEIEYRYLVMGRNHGMVRSLRDTTFPMHVNIAEFENKDVDNRFDFHFLGNNFRSTDINAFIGQLDLKRVDRYAHDRIYNYALFRSLLNPEKFRHAKIFSNRTEVPFCLPILTKSCNAKHAGLEVCRKLAIETRPIISGNLTRQRAYRQYDQYSKFPNAEYLHHNGFYVGLHSGVKRKQVEKLAGALNRI